MKIVKRLAPKLEVLRELYLKSGNQCAFPRCKERIIDSDGTFIGEMCHIEAAMPDGPRFNKSMTNEERRAFSNLILMCHPHHKKTDDVKKYDAGTLVKMKAEHESKFTDIAKAILISIGDATDDNEFIPCKSLRKINKVLEWRHSKTELRASIEEANATGATLKKLPVGTRELLSIIIKRAQPGAGLGARPLEIPVSEVKEVTGSDTETLRAHFHMLDKYGLTREGFKDDFGQDQVEVDNLQSGWSFFFDVKRYCEKTSIDLKRIVVDLDFAALD